MPRCFLSAKIPSAAGGSVMSDDDQESSERRDDNYNLNSEKHLDEKKVKEEPQKNDEKSAPKPKKDIFRPYCLKDPDIKPFKLPSYSFKPNFYNTVFPHFPSLFFPPPHPIHKFPFLSAGSRHLPPPPSAVKQEPDQERGQEPDQEPASGASTPWESGLARPLTPGSPGPAAQASGVYSLNDGKTTAYTYESFFASDGRSKNPGASLYNVYKPKYKCAECGKNYATSSNLSRHKQTHLSLSTSTAKKCGICGKMYVSMPALSMHVLTHSLNHKCHTCGKAFSRPWLLKGHLRSHTGDKPFGCAHCGKCFADRSNLRAHMQTHAAFKNYKCRKCDKSFALKSYLHKHYESGCYKDEEVPQHGEEGNSSHVIHMPTPVFPYIV